MGGDDDLVIEIPAIITGSPIVIIPKYCPWDYPSETVEIEIERDEPECYMCGGIMRQVETHFEWGELWECLECGETQREHGSYGSDFVKISRQEFLDRLAATRQLDLLIKRYGYVPKHIDDYFSAR